MAAYASVTDAGYESEGITDTRWVYLPDYVELLATTSGVRDRLTQSDWRAILSGGIEERQDLATGVYRPSDPGPAYQVLRTTLDVTDYYCSC